MIKDDTTTDQQVVAQSKNGIVAYAKGYYKYILYLNEYTFFY